jgi:hypothetical protein
VALFRQGVLVRPPERAAPYSWERYYLQYPKAWTTEAGIHDLASTTLPEGVEEIRVWTHYSPRTRYVGTVLQKRGKTFNAVRIAFPAVDPAKCEGLVRGVAACAPWDVTWAELERLGVMTLPDASELAGQVIVEDGTGYVVEVQRGGQYRTYHYDNTTSQTWPEARKIEAIASALERQLACK